MNFDSCENQIFKSFGCTKIRKDSKRTKRAETKYNANHNDQRARKANI